MQQQRNTVSIHFKVAPPGWSIHPSINQLELKSYNMDDD